MGLTHVCTYLCLQTGLRAKNGFHPGNVALKNVYRRVDSEKSCAKQPYWD